MSDAMQVLVCLLCVCSPNVLIIGERRRREGQTQVDRAVRNVERRKLQTDESSP
ncbi:hypothetical protein ASPVEDRAFT_44211 [Aspergillus versicolor CBS 583.65]|uniref:Uncharacterized protein n=1 Tax=Aspergillus versicolor CBS 583.65 TaxID=1036611 RepID=A0A1L9PT31_ASPVE|nr:uncharacterized protein ASPVEDRAFT_44211 [Aspergillus versicolor CBS 583.65]OJJ04671.1 hypothetical protein ASPVEDRAFT_44211 [Aspergillus versicolor CBS 583.65]